MTAQLEVTVVVVHDLTDDHDWSKVSATYVYAGKLDEDVAKARGLKDQLEVELATDGEGWSVEEHLDFLDEFMSLSVHYATVEV